MSLLGRRYLLYWAGRVRKGLDIFAREEICFFQGYQAQIGTRSLRQGGYLLSLEPKESDRDTISLLGRRALLSMAIRLIQGLDLFTREKILFLQVQKIQIDTRYLCFGGDLFSLLQTRSLLQSDRHQISLLGRRYFLSRAPTVRQGLDLFTREEISSFQDQQIHIETGSICQRGNLFALGPLVSERDQISSLGRSSLVSRTSRFRQGLDIFAHAP